MKNTILIFVILLINGCCAFTSEDCNCNPPDPELTQEAKDWITPYEVEFLVYDDDNGILDTLQIERVQDTEGVGGDECGTYGDVEKAILRSNSNNKLITISATRINNVGINDFEDGESYIAAYLKIDEEELIVFNENTSGTVIGDYEWNGIETTVIEVNCDNSSACNNLKMKSFTISREIGLLKFTDSNGITWKLIN